MESFRRGQSKAGCRAGDENSHMFRIELRERDSGGDYCNICSPQ
jgi:hypothetical protein